MGRRFNRWQAALVRTILLRVALTAALSLPGMAMANFERGREVAATHCTRCHVVGDINPYGGIESTPSFIGMKRLADWERRYAEFYILPPHPALVRIVEDCRVAALMQPLHGGVFARKEIVGRINHSHVFQAGVPFHENTR